MSTQPEGEYQPTATAGGAEATQDDYKSRTGQSEIPVVGDNAKIEDPIDANTANSDAQLQADDKEAIDQGNVMDSRTRGAGPKGGYTEPGDTEGLPENDGTSRVAQ